LRRQPLHQLVEESPEEFLARIAACASNLLPVMNQHEAKGAADGSSGEVPIMKQRRLIKMKPLLSI